jgi:hypothetical protein
VLTVTGLLAVVVETAFEENEFVAFGTVYAVFEENTTAWDTAPVVRNTALAGIVALVETLVAPVGLVGVALVGTADLVGIAFVGAALVGTAVLVGIALVGAALEGADLGGIAVVGAALEEAAREGVALEGTALVLLQDLSKPDNPGSLTFTVFPTRENINVLIWVIVGTNT